MLLREKIPFGFGVDLARSWVCCRPERGPPPPRLKGLAPFCETLPSSRSFLLYHMDLLLLSECLAPDAYALESLNEVDVAPFFSGDIYFFEGDCALFSMFW